MSSIVAVAGGSGGLGRAIIDALKADKRYTPLILSRKADPELEKETGVRIIAVDYTNVDNLVEILEANNIDTVINTLNSTFDSSPYFNLIQAAETTKATRRFIPNVWSAVREKDVEPDPNELRGRKFAQEKALEKTSLEWTSVYNGLFLDYFSPGIPSYCRPSSFFVDVKNNKAGIPGSGDYPMYFTHTTDIGKYTAALLGTEKWGNRYFIAGDVKTWNEFIAIAERVKDTKFQVSYDSLEKLGNGEFTELPYHEELYSYLPEGVPKSVAQGVLANFALSLARGDGVYGPGSYLNEMFPEIKPLGVEEALEKSFGEARSF